MKPTMLFAIAMISVIVMVAGFHLHMGDITPYPLSPDMAANALFVCPAADGTWDSLGFGLRTMNKYLIMTFFGTALVLMFVWGWQLYINLIKDKFERASFTKVWQITKLWFWAAVIILLCVMTPNHYRRVRVDGDDRAWVMCETNSPGRVPVRASAVHAY